MEAIYYHYTARAETCTDKQTHTFQSPLHTQLLRPFKYTHISRHAAFCALECACASYLLLSAASRYAAPLPPSHALSLRYRCSYRRVSSVAKKNPSLSGFFSQLAAPPALLATALLPSPLACASSTVQQAVKRADVRAQRAACQQLKQLAGETQRERKHKQGINPLNPDSQTAINPQEGWHRGGQKNTDRHPPIRTPQGQPSSSVITSPRHSHPQILV